MGKFLEVILVAPLEILGLLWVYRIKDVVNVKKFVFDDFQLLFLVHAVQYTFCHFCFYPAGKIFIASEGLGQNLL